MKPVIYPNDKHGTDWFVVTGLQSHVTLVVLLFNVLPFPQDTVTPRRHATFFTIAEERVNYVSKYVCYMFYYTKY